MKTINETLNEMAKNKCINVERYQKIIDATKIQSGYSSIYVLNGLDSKFTAQPQKCKDAWDIFWNNCDSCLANYLNNRKKEKIIGVFGRKASLDKYFTDNFNYNIRNISNFKLLRILIEHEMQFHERSWWHRFKDWVKNG